MFSQLRAGRVSDGFGQGGKNQLTETVSEHMSGMVFTIRF